MIKNVLSSFAATVLTILLTTSCSPGSVWVKVQGNKFIGPDGNELVLRKLLTGAPTRCALLSTPPT